jgi:hypothetical protein
VPLLPASRRDQSLGLLDQLRRESRQLYEDSLTPAGSGAYWRQELTEARLMAVKAFRASNLLTDIVAALEMSGAHMTVFRNLMAPPASQDQFKLICPAWPKSSEQSGTGIRTDPATAVAHSFRAWRSPRLSPWLDANRIPTRAELKSSLNAVSLIIAQQRLATARRIRIANIQETALMDRLEAGGWERIVSRAIDHHGALASRQFMHKARFASGKTGRAEIDIALGLAQGIVLAMECKVTNDETNSVKRVNDVLKKAAAWRDHWGNFVQPAALLEGVIKQADVARLVENNVMVFWSHRLDLLERWLEDEI